MTDEQLMRLKVYGNNVQRYRRLLNGNLTEQERQFVERRLTEEQLAIQSLTGDGLPLCTSKAYVKRSPSSPRRRPRGEA
ncbi:hypothetical protein [Bradyrhizobium mercantei]|uniref:hypothetical protein n=1 Tax=Bradyrhizobium mercantei TaxID=1904807 RepID=UPI0009785A1D|nr:hypothetical protein [Bradyrhizobium mercantei]